MKKKLIRGLLKGVTVLPLPALYALAATAYILVYHIVRYRLKVVRKNLRDAFPGKSSAELKAIEKEFYRHLCDIMVETVKLLNVSDDELAKRIVVVNRELVNSSVEQGKSVVLLLGHYANWEWVQQISRVIPDGIFKASIYRPLRNKDWDELYRSVRSRWGVDILPQSLAVKTLLDHENRPWVCGFIADGRPEKGFDSNLVEFLNHETSFIYGPEVIGRKVNADFFFLEMERTARGRYAITFHKLSDTGEDPASYPYMRAFWHEFEKVVRKTPALWLWSHNRWKRDRIIESPEP